MKDTQINDLVKRSVAVIDDDLVKRPIPVIEDEGDWVEFSDGWFTYYTNKKTGERKLHLKPALEPEEAKEEDISPAAMLLEFYENIRRTDEYIRETAKVDTPLYTLDQIWSYISATLSEHGIS